jgi:aspartate racemase
LHRGVVRLVKNTNYARFTREETFLLLAPISFDASTLEIWGSLLNGARLVLFPDDLPSLTRLAQVLWQEQVTTLWLTAGLFHQMVETHLDALVGVSQLLAGGDVLSVSHVQKVLQAFPDTTVINGYGPTENTTFTCCHPMHGQLTLGSSIPIGRPIANTTVYILDTELSPVPIGVVGELYTGGDGLAEGYHNRPDLTAERFVPDPFSGRPGARLYRTGDLARYLQNGDIEFIGRKDTQVKIRGFRIECGEIETVLKQHPAIKEVVVLPQSNPSGDKYLAAYLVTREEESLSTQTLRQYLQHRLPEYMLPTYFHMLHEFPLTTNGKVDRQALLSIEPSYEVREIVRPRDTLEFTLLQIWEEVLDQHPLGVTDSFFDLGGHSMLAVRLMSRIDEQLGYDLPLSTLFLHPTVADLAIIIRQQTALEQWSIAVPLQQQGTRSPFFCVHPSGGTIFCYQALANLLKEYEQPFYGLQTPEFEENENADQSVASLESIAANYIAALRQIQPQGPYQLGGWSLGGIIAFEMAQQLRLQNEEVALLAIIDSRVPFQCLKPGERIEPLAEREKLDLDDTTVMRIVAAMFHLPLPEPAFTSWDLPSQLNYVWQQAKDIRLIPEDVTPHRFRKLMRMHARNYVAERGYQPGIYPGKIIYFRASAGVSEPAMVAASPNLPELSLGWSALTSQEIQVHIVPGNHTSMLEEPNVQTLAAYLRRYLISE